MKSCQYNACNISFLQVLYQVNKKLSTICYNCFIHVGIVDLDGQLPCRPSNKPHHNGGAIHCYSCMVVANQWAQPPGASSEGVGQGRSSRVLFSLRMRLRKKNISLHKQIYFIILHPSRLFRHQNDGITLSPRPPPVESPCLSLLHHTHVFLVGCCIWNIDRQPFKFKTMKFFIFNFFVAQFAAPNNGMASAPYVLPRSCALPNIPPTVNADFWLVVVLSDQKMAT